jgi:hypothetical protein
VRDVRGVRGVRRACRVRWVMMLTQGLGWSRDLACPHGATPTGWPTSGSRRTPSTVTTGDHSSPSMRPGTSPDGWGPTTTTSPPPPPRRPLCYTSPNIPAPIGLLDLETIPCWSFFIGLFYLPRGHGVPFLPIYPP